MEAQPLILPKVNTSRGTRDVMVLPSMVDVVHLAADGSLKVLWDSQTWAVQFLFNKFDPPVIDGGQIYVPNYNGGVDVYQLSQKAE